MVGEHWQFLDKNGNTLSQMCKYFAGRITLLMCGAARSAGRVVSTLPYRDAVAVRPDRRTRSFVIVRNRSGHPVTVICTAFYCPPWHTKSNNLSLHHVDVCTFFLEQTIFREKWPYCLDSSFALRHSDGCCPLHLFQNLMAFQITATLSWQNIWATEHGLYSGSIMFWKHKDSHADLQANSLIQ
jgi:hypothetical protein